MVIAIIVQARMASTRLPGKVLKEVMGKPLLEYQIERLKRVKAADTLIIATTINQTDEPIIDLCNHLSVKYFRGSEENVLARYYYAAKESKADVIVRVTSDCPLIDPKIISQIIEFYIHNYPKYDYVSNTLERTFPRGMDTEVFSFESLEQAFNESTKNPEREHVTPFIYQNSQRYKLKNINYISDVSKYRWTVDTPEDFELIRLILENYHFATNNSFDLEDCLQLVDDNPSWSHININIKQKQLGE